MSSWVVSEQAWRKGPWTPEEDKLLIEYVNQHGEGRWSCVSKLSGLKRSGKSCRLRWVNYLRPGLKKGSITPQEEGIIIELHALWGNKWSTIARYLPGRTDNEIKNYWRTHFKKRSKPSSSLKSDQAETIKYTVHHQKQQQQANHENGIDNINEEVSSHHAPYDDGQDISKHENKAGDLTYPNMGSSNNNNNNQLLSTMFNQDYIHSGYNNWDDFLMVENSLWGGLWNQE